jgi:putative membrane-bound dehydrogenase-like protein
MRRTIFENSVGRRASLLFAVLVFWFAAGCSSTAAQGFAPEEAAQRMTVPAGIGVQLFAAEPLVRQPVAMTFDERGRLWVIQYLQYPNPAGLKRVKVDRYSRTEYDRVPEPPPHGPRGADRITILEDSDGDGRADRAKDFIAGLNLASGMLHGRGGLYVLQTPYLLFYPDRNRDDLPDGDPEVLLTGFGMQDAHAVANSLAWGPDGWLYGAQGSTVTANIRGITFQQGIWRFHPVTHAFELFAEGGGNTWGLDFDRHGNLLAGTNVGGYAMLHQVQGGSYWKSFGKHGELRNPYAFGYLEHVAYADFRGGHVTCGGIVYQGNSFPEPFRDRYIAANLLSHSVQWHELEPCGSTFTAKFGGELLASNDSWFAPVDVALAPDGALFVADWHDERTAHPDPDATWDRTNGRIYRLQAEGAKPLPSFDLSQLESEELVAELNSTSGWHRATARRLLIERADATAGELLRQHLNAKDDGDKLECLWTLHGQGALTAEQLAGLLRHEDQYVRMWAVRLLADSGQVSEEAAHRLVELATREPSPAVRSQLACTAQRLPANQALPIVYALLRHDNDTDDSQIPLLLWWALERHAESSGPILAAMKDSAIWNSKLMRAHLVERLARRWMAPGGVSERLSCAALLGLAPSTADRQLVVQGMNAGLRGQHFESTPEELTAALADQWSREPRSAATIELGLRLGHPGALAESTAIAADDSRSEAERVAQIRLLGEIAAHQSLQALHTLFASPEESEGTRAAALSALGTLDDAAVSNQVLASYAQLPPSLRNQAIVVLAARKTSAATLLQAVLSQTIPAADISAAQQRQLASHDNRELDALITNIWGRVNAATPEEKLAVVRRLNNDLRAAAGNAENGKLLFREHCGKCHKLFGEGTAIGPDLTAANRGDRDFLLVSLVDPNSQVRKEFLSHVVQTVDGRVLTGIVVDESAAALILLDANNQRPTVNKNDIEAIEPSTVSLMPEGLLEKLSPGQLRDLFSYLQAPSVP